MSLWDRYRVGSLPEEQRADVLKEQIKQHEETARARIGSSTHQTVRGMGVVGAALVLFFICLFSYFSIQEWKEVRIKELMVRAPAPVVCPPPPPVVCPTMPFDIRVSPAASATPTK